LHELKVIVDKMIHKPELAVIIVGERPDSKAYVQRKHKACREIGIVSIEIEFGENVSENELLSKSKIVYYSLSVFE
jgi:5,10-methylene-tetrahydrofolate dehydrogenase/methenyl tetrahydrofolate cyclohydrolase